MDLADKTTDAAQMTVPGAAHEPLIAAAAILEGLPDAVVAATIEGRIVFVNALAEELFGYPREELIGGPVQRLWPERLRERYTGNMLLYFATQQPLRFTAEAFGLRKDGTEFVGEMSWGVVETTAGPLLLAIGRDISERLSEEARLRHEAVHDPLTGLANRTLLRDRLEHALARSQREGRATGVLFIDLDDFKRINDNHGHATGDAVLVELGRRLRTAVRPADTVARLGGDEFVVVCEEVDRDAVLALGRRLHESIVQPIRVGAIAHRLSASIGIALGHSGADALISDADKAVYRAKAEGRGRVELFR